MPLPDGLKAGDHVLLSEPFGPRGLGVLRGTVERDGQTWFEIVLEHDAGKRVFVRTDHADTLGAPMGETEAKSIVAAFSAPESLVPDHRDFEQQTIETMKALARGSWSEIQQALSRLYAFAWKPAFGQHRFMDLCEKLLVPVLAHALGREYDALVEELRAGKPAFAATTPRPAPPFDEPPACPPLDLDELEGLFPLTVTGELAFFDTPGAPERPNDHVARIAVLPGTWHSYARRADGGEELFLLHESRLAEGGAALVASPWYRAAELVRTVGAGMIHVMDRAAREDTWTLDRMLYLPGEHEHRGRALTIGTEGWAGPLPIFAAGDLPDRIKIVIG